MQKRTNEPSRRLEEEEEEALNPQPPAPAQCTWANVHQDCAVRETAEPVKDGQVGEMTPKRAAFFLERFKREEKLLGPNEQWALEYAIEVLEAEPVKVPSDEEIMTEVYAACPEFDEAHEGIDESQVISAFRALLASYANQENSNG